MQAYIPMQMLNNVGQVCLIYIAADPCMDL